MRVLDDAVFYRREHDSPTINEPGPRTWICTTHQHASHGSTDTIGRRVPFLADRSIETHLRKKKVEEDTVLGPRLVSFLLSCRLFVAHNKKRMGRLGPSSISIAIC